MKPIDLPPHNLPDALRADLCRPAEHESYLSKPADDDGHDHEDVPPTQPPPPTFPPELTVPSVSQMNDGVWRLRHEREKQRRFYATVSPNPDEAAGPVFYRPTTPAATAAPE